MHAGDTFRPLLDIYITNYKLRLEARNKYIKTEALLTLYSCLSGGSTALDEMWSDIVS